MSGDTPKLLFIDTCIYRRKGFNFAYGRFRNIAQYSKTGYLRLLTTSITDREVKANIREMIGEALPDLKRFQKRGIFKTIDADLMGRVDSKFLPLENAAILFERYNEFLRDSAAQTVPLDGDSIDSVFDAYFSESPPFGRGKKKDEIPDAVVVASLLKYAKATGLKIHILTDDDGIVKACDGIHLLPVTDFGSFMNEHNRGYDDFRFNKVIAIYREHDNEFLECIEDAFGNLGYEVTDGRYYSDSCEAEIENVDVDEINVESVLNDRPLVTISGRITVKLNGSYEDYDYATYDHEDNVHYNVVSREFEHEAELPFIATIDFIWDESDLSFKKILNVQLNWRDVVQVTVEEFNDIATTSPWDDGQERDF